MPAASIIVCTRNRGEAIAQTIRSLLASRHSAFEIIVVDQSTDTTTQSAVSAFESDTRIRYLSTPTVGLSIARNIGLREARNNLVLMTDDDCDVPPEWVEIMIDKLLMDDSIALVFCDVLADPYDVTLGFIPVSVGTGDTQLAGIANWSPADGINVGIGAAMALRRDVVLEIGGFDEALGAGTAFGSGEDLDICLRVLLSGHQIVRTVATAVRHHGFRTHEQGKKLVRQTYYSVGAVYGKCLRGTRLGVVVPLSRVVWSGILRPIGSDLAKLRKPPVWGRSVNLVAGLVKGMTSAIDSKRLVFRGAPVQQE